MSRTAPTAPRIVVTVAVAERQSDPAIAARKNALYAASVARHGGEPIVLDATADEETRAAAFAAMDGLLLSGGADLHPERYGQPSRGSTTMEPDRDALEAEAWIAAQARAVPVLGICRGFQAINAFSGGTLLQHVDGHQGPRWGKRPGEDPSAAGRARARDSPGSSSRPTPAAASCASTRTTTRRSGRPTWRRASSPTPGRAARPAT